MACILVDISLYDRGREKHNLAAERKSRGKLHLSPLEGRSLQHVESGFSKVVINYPFRLSTAFYSRSWVLILKAAVLNP